MRPLALAAAATLGLAALACGGGDSAPDPVQPDRGAAGGSPDVVANPQVFFVQIDT